MRTSAATVSSSFITSPDAFPAVRTGLEVIAAIRALHSDEVEWSQNDGGYWIDRLLGTDRPRRALDDAIPVKTILERERAALERFARVRAEQLRY